MKVWYSKFSNSFFTYPLAGPVKSAKTGYPKDDNFFKVETNKSGLL